MPSRRLCHRSTVHKCIVLQVLPRMEASNFMLRCHIADLRLWTVSLGLERFDQCIARHTCCSRAAQVDACFGSRHSAADDSQLCQAAAAVRCHDHPSGHQCLSSSSAIHDTLLQGQISKHVTAVDDYPWKKCCCLAPTAHWERVSRRACHGPFRRHGIYMRRQGDRVACTNPS